MLARRASLRHDERVKTDPDRWSLSDPVTVLPGVGPKRCAQLLQLGVLSLGDLLLHLPHRYEDRRSIVPIGELGAGMSCTVRGDVLSVSSRRIHQRGTRFEAVIKDDSGVLSCIWFNAAYLGETVRPNTRVMLFGKVGAYKGGLSMSHPDIQVIRSEDDEEAFASLIPIYPTTDGLSQAALRAWITAVLPVFLKNTEERLPDALREKCAVPDVERALKAIHQPETLDEAMTARYRFVFEEFFEIQLILALRKAFYADRIEGQVHKGDGRLTEKLIESLPFALTEDQERVLCEIRADMGRRVPLHRLVQGDVGSGKTLVAVLAMLTAIESGSQAAMMVPTEVLARQHAGTLSGMLEPLGLMVGWLAGSVKGARREEVLSQVSAGEVDILVGTHALIQEWVEFERLGLVVIDEQHKFGVAQRGAIYGKGTAPDVLVMTATPIPRTLAMTVYGDLDISVIRSMPMGRQAIETRVIDDSKLGATYDFICRQVHKGRQAYVVYPLVEESETTGLKSVLERFEVLSNEAFAGVRCAFLHGRLSAEKKKETMERFAGGDVDVLFATTVVEVGVDVPNATVMVVENAERFGLSQLHQLRGRIGRGSHKSFCVLQTDSASRDSWKRLKVLEESADGFQISEADAAIRGTGNILGREQSGLPRLRIADPVEDVEVLKVARREAFDLVESDPALERHPALKARVIDLYNEVEAYVTVG